MDCRTGRGVPRAFSPGGSLDLETVKVHTLNSTAYVTMNRPDRRNAFNSQMVADLTSAFTTLLDHECRCIVLTGDGPAFSAGADLEYMREIKDAGHEANVADATALADLLHLIYTHPKAVIAQVNGPAIGGGLGLVAACDVAIAKRGAFFAFSEVRLGLVPSVIGPYVVKTIGESAARRYMLTGDRFNAETAETLGLVHQVVVQGDLENSVRNLTASFEATGPEALKVCKDLVRRCGEEPLEKLRPWTAELIATLRAGDEGQEGMTSFLEKRDPAWRKA